jgi:hypothetical protein
MTIGRCYSAQMPRVIVLHQGYGCASGCCGHVVMIGTVQAGRFSFSHPASRAEIVEYVQDLVTEQLGEEHVADIDWAGCIVTDD